MNVILIVVDTLRADHLGCYGYFRDTSPTIDRLANEGVLFPDAHATAVATGPAFTSIITGLYPIHHGCYVTPYNLFNLFDIDDSISGLAEMVWQKGYTTCAFDGLLSFASPMKQMARGFEYYVNYSLSPLTHMDRKAAQCNEDGAHGFRGHIPASIPGGVINKRLLPWIREHSEEPFFLFVHYWEPHAPYNQPEEFRGLFHHKRGDYSDLKVERSSAGYEYVPGWGKVGELWEEEKDELSIDLYDGEVRYVDTLIKEVIDSLYESGIADDSLIILTADHGEQLGQHGIYGHGGLHEAVTHIPLIMWGPKSIPGGKVIPGYVHHVDIAPTVLDVIGSETTPALDGTSLLPIIDGRKTGREELVLEDEEERALLCKGWKYIYDYERDVDALYDLANDPMEVVNLAEKEGSRRAEMRTTLEEWVDTNLAGRSDPLMEAIAKWRSLWKAQLGTDFPTSERPIL